MSVIGGKISTNEKHSKILCLCYFCAKRMKEYGYFYQIFMFVIQRD